jgi:tetratricopeptide (TPR) repeat protein
MRVNKRRVTRKQRVMRGGKTEAELRQIAERNTRAMERDARASERNAIEAARIEAARIESARIEAARIEVVDISRLPNRKREQNIDQFCVNGPDYLHNQEYQDIQEYYSKLDPNSKEKTRVKQLLNQGKIESRTGKIRCKEGFYVFEEIPGFRNITTLNKLLKFVIVKRNSLNDSLDDYMILWSYANMLNYDYADEYFKKWIDYGSSKKKNTVRTEPKDVVLITKEIIKEIEDLYGSELVNKNLLLTKSYNPDKYDGIVYSYFSNKGYDMENTVFICPIYEIPHSAIANHYVGFDLKKINHEIAVYAGLEGIFYRNQDETLCFVIGNLSGHYKTPKSRMEFVMEILQQYDFENIRIIADPNPPSPPSSLDTDDSSNAPREEYRRFMTNDPYITNFEEALGRLNAADITPVVSAAAVHKGLSQEMEWK